MEEVKVNDHIESALDRILRQSRPLTLTSSRSQFLTSVNSKKAKLQKTVNLTSVSLTPLPEPNDSPLQTKRLLMTSKERT